MSLPQLDFHKKGGNNPLNPNCKVGFSTIDIGPDNWLMSPCAHRYTKRIKINNNLLSVLDFYENKNILSRALNHIEFNFEDLYLRFQSGMRNPDYPAPISRKVFVLDYDCYSSVLIDDLGDLENKLVKSHELISQMFNKSVTENLKGILNGK